jgi:hypothetical protein
MIDNVQLIVAETARRNGQWDCYVDGQWVLTSAQPLCAVARLLMDRGYDPNAYLILRREGRDAADLKAPLGVAAAWSVKTDRCGKPVFVPWTGSKSTAAASPMRKTGRRVPYPAPGPKKRMAA